jgi:hypothetical protein
MKPIAETLHARFPRDFFEVRIPTRAVPKAKDRQAVAAAIVEAAAEIQAELRRGSMGRGRTVEDAPGVPFPMMVFFGAHAETREGQVFTGPYGPDDALAMADLRRALMDKHSKLTRYRAGGASTILLLDVPETFAFHGYFWQMFLELAEEVPHDGYDDVVLAGSAGRPPFFHLLKRDGALVRAGGDYADFIEAQARVLYPESDCP